MNFCWPVYSIIKLTFCHINKSKILVYKNIFVRSIRPLLKKRKSNSGLNLDLHIYGIKLYFCASFMFLIKKMFW